jgi:hypothetical protein
LPKFCQSFIKISPNFNLLHSLLFARVVPATASNGSIGTRNEHATLNGTVETRYEHAALNGIVVVATALRDFKASANDRFKSEFYPCQNRSFETKSTTCGGHENNVFEPRPKCCVRWALDVYKIPCSSISHTVRNYHHY